MPAISRRQERIRLEKIRLLIAEGKTQQEIMDAIGVSRRTLNRYENMIREDTIAKFDGKRVVDLWTAHKKRMDTIIQECREKIALGSQSDVSPEKLYRQIQQASESIIDMGIKIGIVPTVTQRLSVDMEVKQEDDKLKQLLGSYRTEIADTQTTEPSEETN